MADKGESLCCIGIVLIIAVVALIALFNWNSIVGTVVFIIITVIFLIFAWNVGFLDFIRWETSSNIALYSETQKEINEFEKVGVIVRELNEKLSKAQLSKDVELLKKVRMELYQMDTCFDKYKKLLLKYKNLMTQNKEIIGNYFKTETEEIDKLFDKAILRLETDQLESELSKFEMELNRMIENKKKGY